MKKVFSILFFPDSVSAMYTLSGKDSSRRAAALYNLSVIIASLDATSPSRRGLGRRFVFRLIRRRLQNHHLPQGKDFAPAVQTGAKRQTPKTRRYAKGSPTRGAVAAKPVTERLDKGEACHRPQTLRHRFGSAAPLYNLSFALFLPHLLLH